MPHVEVCPNVNIFYRVLSKIDKAPLLALFHGYGSDHHSFDVLLPFLVDDYQVLVWDHRGHGKSDKPKVASDLQTQNLYTMKKLAKDAKFLLEYVLNNELETKSVPVFLYGQSMGGMVAQTFVINYPSFAEKMALSSTSPSNKTPEFLKMIEALRSGALMFSREYIKKTTLLSYVPSYVKKHPEVIEKSIQRKMRVGPKILKALAVNIVENYELEEGLSKVTIPTLVLHGEKDERINVSSGKKIHELLPNSTLVTFPNQGHGLDKEIPEKVAQSLKSFFLKDQ